MSQTFDPKRVLRQVSNHLLQDLFEAHQHDLELPWDQLEETDVDPIFNAWQALPEADCREIEIVLREVCDMACGDEGTRAICEEAIRQGNQQLLDDLEGLDSRHDKAVFTYIHADEVWNVAVQFARADSLTHGRYWIKRCDIPSKSPDTSETTIKELEVAFSAFFRASQARGRRCEILHYDRANGADYFFAYLEDYADTYVAFNTEEGCKRNTERRAFELVLVYDRQHGTLEMYARGGKDVYIPLQEIFCRVVLNEEIGIENRKSHPYELNGILSPSFQFATDPADGIETIRIRKLRLSVKGAPRRRITLEADPEGGVNDIYEMLSKYLNQQRLPISILDVSQVGLKLSFDGANEDLPKSLSFELSYPNSSNLRSKPEAARALAEKYLRQWGMDRAATHENAESTA